jgi:hypothetical protein
MGLAELGTGALGAVVGWVAKEVIDFFKAKQAVRHDLQKRFFDVRLEATLKALQKMKTASSALHMTLHILQKDIASGGNSVNPAVMVETLAAYQAEIKAVSDNAAGAVALFRFFQGETIATKAEQAGQTVVMPVLQGMEVMFSTLSAHRKAVESLPANQQEPAFAQAVKADSQLQGDSAKLLALAKALDERVDGLTDELREIYKPVFAYGFES